MSELLAVSVFCGLFLLTFSVVFLLHLSNVGAVPGFMDVSHEQLKKRVRKETRRE
jgi:hypothetical protein